MREETLAILHETRATSIVVTHDAEEAMRMGDRVALMRQGRIVQIGKALDLYRAPKDILTARAFSDLNELAARIEQGQRGDGARPLRRQGLRRRRGAIVCVRQRGVRLLRPGEGVPARVLHRAFSATTPWSSLPCKVSTRRYLARVRESDVPSPGTELGVGVDAGAVLVFAAENGDRQPA